VAAEKTTALRRRIARRAMAAVWPENGPPRKPRAPQNAPPREAREGAVFPRARCPVRPAGWAPPLFFKKKKPAFFLINAAAAWVPAGWGAAVKNTF